MVAPDGTVTFATFAKSGTAPPAHLEGSCQLPLPPPVQATEFKRVTLLDVEPVAETT